MSSLHVGSRAARALLAGLLLAAAGAHISAQSLAPAATSPKTPTASSKTGTAAKTASAHEGSSTATSTPAPAPSPAAAPLVPPPERATAQADDAASSPHAPGDAPTENEMPNIVVSAATRNSQAPNTTATDTTVITEEELASAQYQTVSDALTKVPGVSVTPYGAPGQLTSVFLHGNDSNQTLLTIDGRPQPAGLSGAYDFSGLTLDNISQIEVVKTPSSSIAGDAAGGVINLVSLNGRGLDHPVSSVSFEGGSHDSFREQVQSRGSEGNFDYAVSGSETTGDGNRLNENYRNTVYRGNFGYQITPTIYFDVHTGYSLIDAGSPGSLTFFDPIAHIRTQDWFISPEVSAKVTDFYTTKVWYDHDQSRQTYLDFFSGAYTPSDTRLDIATDSYDWQNNLQLAHNWQITAGVQGSTQHAQEVDDESAVELANFETPSNINNHLDNNAGYIQSQWQPLTGLNVLTSARYDVYSDYGNAFSWRQGVSYEVAPTKTVLHASGSSSYTPPSTQDLYYPGFSNPNLKPETTLGWEAGVSQPLFKNRLTPSATYFQNDIRDDIVDDANFIPQNIDRATTEGVELDLAAQPIDPLKLDLNYTYLDAKDDTTDTRLIRRPRDTVNFTIDYTPIEPLTLDLGGSWIVNRDDGSPEVEQPDYFVLRASATYRINKYVTIWARGENLTNQYYEPVLGYPALGIGGYGGIKVSF
jgi:vitamin B12 transporter